jgi:hypothetical protein
MLNSSVESNYTLDKLRSTLIRLEDTIIFGNLLSPFFFKTLMLSAL